MRKELRLRLASAALMLAGAGMISYGFASMGEPQAVWLWRDMLGVL